MAGVGPGRPSILPLGGGSPRPREEEEEGEESDDDGAEYENDEPLMDLVSSTQEMVIHREIFGFGVPRVGMKVDLSRPTREEAEDGGPLVLVPGEETDFLHSLLVFFSLVSSHPRIRSLSLHHGDFCGADDDFPTNDAADWIFGTVLPNHPSLRKLAFIDCQIHPYHVQGFVNALPSRAAGTLKLSLEGTPLNIACFRSIKSMLQRGARVVELSLGGCGMDSDGCRLVCEGASESRHLRKLSLEVASADLAPGCVDPAVIPSSVLRELNVRSGAVAGDFLRSLAATLRSNKVLEQIGLFGHCSEQDSLPMEDLLRAHNYTLSGVSLGLASSTNPARDSRIDVLLRRNHQLREFLQSHPRCAVPCRALWPTALQRLGTFPELVYRFVRSGNVEAFSDQLLLLAALQ